MTFAKYFKASSYCLIGSGFAAMASTGMADAVSTGIFAVAFVLSILMDTARLRRTIPSWALPGAAIAYACFIPVDYRFVSHSFLLTFQHLVVATAVAKLLTCAKDRDYVQLYLLSLTELLLAALFSAGLAFILWFLVFVFAGLNTLVLLEMRRSNFKIHRQARILPFVPTMDTQEAGMELFTPFPAGMFFAIMAGIGLLVLAGAIPLFFLLPRMSQGAQRLPQGATQFVSGFAERIELGRSGTIRQSDAIVMRVKTDAPPAHLAHALKWRGLAFDHYDGRAWSRSDPIRQSLPVQGRFHKLENYAQGTDWIRQTFFLEALSTDVIFAANRALAISLDAGSLQRDSFGNLYAAPHPHSKLRYVAVSDPIQPDAARIEDAARIFDAGGIFDAGRIPPEIRQTYLQLPALSPQIAELAKSATRRATSRYAQARMLESYLRTHYAYSLSLRSSPGRKDPLAMFLLDVRAGHCEYFATAMTIMLRQLGIPARLVNGFQMGEYNALGGSWTVRQYHAHSWTEAFFPPYGWIEFDPTPAAPRRPQPVWSQLYAVIRDAVGLWWWEGILNYDPSKQYHLVQALLSAAEAFRAGAQALVSSIFDQGRETIRALRSPLQALEFADIRTIGVPALVLAAFCMLRPLRRRLRMWLQPLRYRNNPQAGSVRFYADALELLKTHGWDRPAGQTPLEFAHTLRDHPAGVPFLSLTQLYNAARFGEPQPQFPYAEARSLRRSLERSLRRS